MIRRHFLAGFVGIQAMCAAAALAFGAGQAEAAVLWKFDATVLQAGLQCDEGDCGGVGSYDYEVGATGSATALVQKGQVTLKFMEDVLYQGALESNASGYYSFTDFSSAFEYAELGWNELSGYFSYTADFFPDWEVFRLSLDNPIPAPIPLPATAALLPMGLGALAFLRRRRKA